MKKLCMIALVLVLTVCLLAGCRVNNSGDTSAPSTTVTPTTTQPTTRPTTQPTQPSTDMTMPGMDDLVPGTDDTIDPSNGANQSTGDTQGRSRGMSAY